MSAILKALAKRYRDSVAGSTGAATRDFLVDFRVLIKSAGCEDGEAYVTAVDTLREAARLPGSCLKLDAPRRSPEFIETVRLTREGGEAWLFGHLGETCPTQERHELADMIVSFMEEVVPESWSEAWQSWCAGLAERARHGGVIAPLSRSADNTELLRVLVRVLNWREESLIRFASCVICGDSKRLGDLRSKLEDCLTQMSGGTLSELKDVGILDHPRQVLLHGPLRLVRPNGMLNLGCLEGPVAISETDLVEFTCDASRCLTIENETTFRELAKLGSGVLLIHTSYPGRAVVSLLSRLPEALPCHHFGDTDPAGFGILRDLRLKTGREISALHMEFRDGADTPVLSAEEKRQVGRLMEDELMQDVRPQLERMLEAGRKGVFEQESLGIPKKVWPFY